MEQKTEQRVYVRVRLFSLIASEVHEVDVVRRDDNKAGWRKGAPVQTTPINVCHHDALGCEFNFVQLRSDLFRKRQQHRCIAASLYCYSATTP